MNITVVGTGYVGLVTGACFAKYGHKVFCVDIDEEKVRLINDGVSPIFEEGLSELLSEFKHNIVATTSLSEALENSDLCFICVGTPSREDGSIDLSFVESVSREIGLFLKDSEKFFVVVVKSTVVPGSTRDVVIPLLEEVSGKKAGVDFGVAMNPEFLREGLAVSDVLSPDRVVIGSVDEKPSGLVRSLYESEVCCPIVETSVTAAEMIKYASNCFLATKISFSNEIGNFCKKLGIDSYEVADGMGLDKRIGREFLNSGIGWGGSCFPKDLHALSCWAEKMGLDSGIIDSVIAQNDLQPLKVLELLSKHIPNIAEKSVAVLGLSFKPGTDDIRYSRALPIIDALVEMGAKVRVFDPEAMTNFRKIRPDLVYAESAGEAVLGVEAVVIATEWDEFRGLDYSGLVVIDGRRVLEAKSSADVYDGVCW